MGARLLGFEWGEALNDPVAEILTMSIALTLVGQGTSGSAMLVGVLLQLLVGAVFGLGVGFGGRRVSSPLNSSVHIQNQPSSDATPSTAIQTNSGAKPR